MFTHSTRRWLAGLGVAGALIAASATPAYADEDLQVHASDLLVAPNHTVASWIAAWNPATELRKLTLDLDLSKVDGIGVLEPVNSDFACAREAAVLHCEATIEPDGNTPFFDYFLTAKADAKPGEKAEMGVKITGDGQTVERAVSITVAEGVDLQSEPEGGLEAEAGTVAVLPSTVRNGGENTSRGAVLRLQNDGRSPYVGNFSNCEYIDYLATVCTFDTDLEPGKSYRLSEGLPVRVDKDARAGSHLLNLLDWWTKDDWALIANDPSWPLPEGEQGTGAELKLVEAPATALRAPQTDVDRWNSFTDFKVTVTGGNTADLAAVGSTATGKVGDKVTVRAGARNLGPAVIETWRNEGPLVVVEIPAGTTAVTVSENCAPYTRDEEWYPWESLGEPGAPVYGCIGYEDLGRDDTASFEFVLKIDKLDSKTSGTVSTMIEGDPNASNNVAPITVALGDKSGNPGGEPGQGGGNGDGGSLPITGANTALVAGLGAVLLAAGGAGFVVARRRRTRFVA
ncbi:LPXTG cell wall anchor domain-containing protein [Micromonospora sp. BQ11]|uniref:LPXTG cell wall anchor domain-containing protein n=1 Tax=Micromonospora sp. BQ11 TaxID=3452212 RepID=UPI003F8CEA4B